MADILIKNMEMPKEGSITITIRHDGAINVIGDMGSNLGRLVDCKAIEFTEHGRLCDFDKFYEYIDYYLCKNCEKACSDCDVPWIKKVISQSPVVLGEQHDDSI